MKLEEITFGISNNTIKLNTPVIKGQGRFRTAESNRVVFNGFIFQKLK